MAPGEPEARSRAARTRTGIPIPGATWAELSDLARRSGVDIPG
jgi:LDH2 family malate/lactate/ureidoglycolate dehydrogenase